MKGEIIKLISQTTPSVAVFVDGVELDRACKRRGIRIDLRELKRRADLIGKGVLRRYYTVIPNEDDSRHRSFLNAVRSTGFDVIIKRLPPKGVDRQVSPSVEMSCDILAFALSRIEHANVQDSAINNSANDDQGHKPLIRKIRQRVHRGTDEKREERGEVVIVCPSWDLDYVTEMVKEIGIKVRVYDFGERRGNVANLADDYIDIERVTDLWDKR